MLNYLLAIIGGIVALYGGTFVVGYIREWLMFRDFVSRMPQTPDEWEQFWEEDSKHLDRFLED